MRTYQVLLIDELSQRRQRNAQFSLRAFARMLEISPSHLSSLISGQKNLTQKVAAKIANKLELTPLQQKEIIQSTLNFSETEKSLQDSQLLLKEDQFQLISRWYYYAILSLSQLPDNCANGKWIGERLGISAVEAIEALNRLLRLKLISIENGRFMQTTAPLSTTTDVPSGAIRQHHKENLELALEKIDTVPIEKRNFTSVTMAVNPKKISKVKKMMDEFKLLACEELEQGSKSEVYTLAMQLFPVTQGEKK